VRNLQVPVVHVTWAEFDSIVKPSVRETDEAVLDFARRVVSPERFAEHVAGAPCVMVAPHVDPPAERLTLEDVRSESNGQECARAASSRYGDHPGREGYGGGARGGDG
jgi:hypothetical protein